MLYMTDKIPALPWRIDSLRSGNTTALPELLQQFIFSDDSWNEGMYYSIQCNEEVPFSSPTVLESANENVSSRLLDVFGGGENYQNCAVWGTGQPPFIENEAVISDIPTLILSGEFDPITPPAWGRLTAEHLDNSQFLEFPGFGHGVMGSGLDGGLCSKKIVEHFLGEPDASVDASCIDSYGLVFMTK
jgi:pimeloyl-ACP methyl ester carboxylesterase